MIWELVLIMAVFFGTCGLGALLMVIEHWWSKRKRRKARDVGIVFAQEYRKLLKEEDDF